MVMRRESLPKSKIVVLIGTVEELVLWEVVSVVVVVVCAVLVDLNSSERAFGQRLKHHLTMHAKMLTGGR